MSSGHSENLTNQFYGQFWEICVLTVCHSCSLFITPRVLINGHTRVWVIISRIMFIGASKIGNVTWIPKIQMASEITPLIISLPRPLIISLP